MRDSSKGSCFPCSLAITHQTPYSPLITAISRHNRVHTATAVTINASYITMAPKRKLQTPAPSYYTCVPCCPQTHDLCYDKNGYNYCDCDKGLVACLAQTSVPAGLQGSLQNPLQNSEKRVFKAAATSYFKNTFCKDASKEWRWARNFYVPLG